MKASEQLKKISKKYEDIIPKYCASSDFESVTIQALIDFIKRVKRSLMPSLGPIPDLSEKYKQYRKKHKGNLGDLTKPNKSNATGTGQMLDNMWYEIKPTGFTLFIKDTKRKRELDGSAGTLTNDQVATHYAKKRKIFELSEPEKSRIIRNIKRDLIKILRKA